jgi:serine/threonine protein kinase
MATKTKLAGLLLRYEELGRAGQAPSAEELCRDCPELLEELKLQIEILGPVNPVPRSSQPSERETQTVQRALAGTLQPGSLVQPPRDNETMPLESAPAETSTLEIRPGSEPVSGYRLVARLGRGNFGEVWKAVAPGGFPVALKIMPLQEKVKATELLALEIIKSIRHPNLVAAFGAWQVQGFLIVAMELADRTLWDRLEEARGEGLSGIPPAELLEYLRQAAKGIDYLNERQHTFAGKQQVSIQHRDIKPQNILLVGSGVKVADFGLVRLLDRAMTGHTGNMTPAYAAPEFLQGQTSNQSDQYCLAVTYCELRGGRLPFEGTLAQVLNGHLANSPDLTMLPESERPAVRRALAKEPGERWPSCRAFVEALAESMQTHPVPRREATASRWVAVALVPVLVGLMVIFLPPLLQTPSEPDPPIENHAAKTRANAKLESGVTENEIAHEPARESSEQAARASFAPEEKFARTPQPVDAKLPADPQNEPPAPKVQSLAESKPSAQEAQTLDSAALTKVAATDILRAASRPAENVTTNSEITRELKQDRIGELCRFAEHQRAVRSVAVSPNGGYAISAGEDGVVWLWDVETGQSVHPFRGHRGEAHCVAFSSDARRVISGGEDGSVRLWDIETRMALGSLNGHTEAVYGVAFSSDGLQAVSGGQDTTVRVWSVADGKELNHFNLPPGESVWSLALSRDNRHVLTASDSNIVRLWDVARGEEAHRFEDHRDVVWCVDFSADGARALSGGGLSKGQHDYAVRLWDIENRKLLRKLEGHTGAVRSVAFSWDGRRAISGATDTTVRLWDVDSGEQLCCFQGHEATVHGVTISRNGRRALSASGDGTVRVWGLPP